MIRRLLIGHDNRFAVVKTFTYSLMHMSVAIMVGYALTGNLAVAVSIGLVEPLVQTVFYHLHEKLWKQVTDEPVEVKIHTHSHAL